MAFSSISFSSDFAVIIDSEKGNVAQFYRSGDSGGDAVMSITIPFQLHDDPDKQYEMSIVAGNGQSFTYTTGAELSALGRMADGNLNNLSYHTHSVKLSIDRQSFRIMKEHGIAQIKFGSRELINCQPAKSAQDLKRMGSYWCSILITKQVASMKFIL